MPGVLITAKEIATAAVTRQKAKYDQVTGKAREVRVPCSFVDADVPYAFPHALGRIPVGCSPGPIIRNGTALPGAPTIGVPGVVYQEDIFLLGASRDNIVLRCSTPQSYCDVTIW